jgi:competence protein ComEC
MQRILERTPVIVTLAAFWMGSLASAQSGFFLSALGLEALSATLLLLGQRAVPHAVAGLLATFLAAGRLAIGHQPAQTLDSTFLYPNHVSIFGTIDSQPQFRPTGQSFMIETERVAASREAQETHVKIFVRYAGYEELAPANRVYVKGILTKAPEPGSGSFGLWLQQHGVNYTMWAYSAQNLGPYGWDPLRGVRGQLKTAIRSSLPDPEAAVLLGLTLGDTSGLAPEVRNWFTVTGTAHVLALSGWNVTLVAGLLMVMLTPAVGRRWGAVISALGIGIFVALVGPQPSVVRAGIMGIMVSLAMAAQRGYSSLATLATAALLMTAVDPEILNDVGFRLSFLATAGILLLGPSLRLRVLPKAISDTLAATLAAEAAVLPVVSANFAKVSVIAPFANLALAPLLPLCVLLGYGVALSGLLSTALASAVSWIAWLPTTILLRALEAMASLPASSLPLALTPAGEALIYFGLAVLGFGLWHRLRTVTTFVGGLVTGLLLGLGLLPLTF